jgi:CubicO group peptidase (beta-lactamase class C family)
VSGSEFASLESKITELAAASMKQDRIPGLSIGIVRGDSLAGYYSFGTQTMGEDKPPTAQTISRVASITKTFTGTAILQLRDLGQLELDDPLLLHMPDFTVATAIHGTLEGVTLRRLMTHYSGLRTEHPLTDWDTPSFPTAEELLDGLAEIEVVIPQDSQWKYSNLAVGLLGQVIEQASGIPYERYIYEEITGPLGLSNTRFELDDRQTELKANGYSHPSPGSSELRDAPYASLRGISAAGQLHSNVEDLAKWVSFQFSSGRSTHPSKILASSTLAEMHRPVYMANDWTNGQALSWRMNRRDDLVLHSHGGGIQGFASNVVFSVKDQTGVVVLANIWPAPTPYVLAEDIAELVIRELGGVAEVETSDLVEVPEGVSSIYVGRYWAEPGAYVDVVYDADGFGLGAPREGGYTLHGPAGLATDPTVSDAHAFRVVGGRGAGELAEFSAPLSSSSASFRLGGFLYRRVDS